ncbi:MAG: hypothetical protein JNM17_17620 [Archangium sp.]|nr:hypothetical protein [Archangium sp.]
MFRLVLILALFALPAFADEIVNTAPSNAELGRYSVVKSGDLTARLDSATGAVWFLCPKKNKQAWCRAKEIPALAAGPVGRYRLAETTPLILIDSVTGRSWQRCDLPTPEKGLAWCALED